MTTSAQNATINAPSVDPFKPGIEDPEIWQAIRAAATTLLSKLPARGRKQHLDEPLEVEVSGERYLLRAAQPKATRRCPDELLLVVIERRPRPVGHTAQLRRRFGLTKRQAEVAMLLARRRTTKEIAKILGIRPGTARRHTEDVLLNLGISSRRRVADRIHINA